MSIPTTKTIAVGSGGSNSGSFSGSFQGNGYGLTNISSSTATTATLATTASFLDGFTSNPQTIITPITVAHGLGVVPRIVTLSIINTIAEFGYVPGDIVEIDFSVNASYNIGIGGAVKTSNTITVYPQNVSTPSQFCAIRDNNSPHSNIFASTANWNLIIRAWR